MSASITIQTFRLPQPGDSDPHFGFSRSFYYVGEQRGYWKLIRIRDGGKKKGVTLIPFEQVAAFIRRKLEEQNNDTKQQFESSLGKEPQSERASVRKSERTT